MKLNQLRQQLRSSTLEPADRARDARYRISLSGADALLQFGRHSGELLSDVSRKDHRYLNFILANDFPTDLKDVARELRNRRARSRR